MTKYAVAIALFVHGATQSHAACDGVVSTFTDECTYANFVDHLSADCSLAELFPPNDEGGAANATEEVADLCAYGAAVPFGDIQGTYQRDRRYFAGGGPLVDGAKPRIEAAPIARFEANLADDTLIAFPEYAARVRYNVDAGKGTNGYPANMNLDSGCDLNTVLCCFTEGDFAAEGDATTDVCHHDLRDSPESNHIKRGWSAFPGGEGPTHCVGFTWRDGEEELLGNSMYDVSLRNSANKGYLRGVPGAPMCGCVEHMPVVEEAACRTATKTGTGEITYAFTFHPATEDKAGCLKASNQVGIAYADCPAGDLKAQYLANHAGDAAAAALIGDRLVGAGGCADEVADYLSDHFTVEGQAARYTDPEAGEWSDLLVGQGVHFLPPDLDPAAADAEFRALVDGGCKDADGEGRHCLVRRHCPSCYDSHVDVYYQRLAPLPSPDVNFLDMFLSRWVQAQNDMAAGDFALYSTRDDALAGTGAWTYCNYAAADDNNPTGFPRDCGPTGHVGANWNSYTRGVHHPAKHHGFYVEMPAFNAFGA